MEGKTEKTIKSFKIKAINWIIPQPPPERREDVIVIGQTFNGGRMRLYLQKNQIRNLPGNSRRNLKPGMEIEIKIEQGNKMNDFRKIEAIIL